MMVNICCHLIIFIRSNVKLIDKAVCFVSIFICLICLKVFINIYKYIYLKSIC